MVTVEEMNGVYEYNSFMLETPFKNWDNLLEKIDDKDVYDNEEGEYGKEEEPHITILFGLHEEVSFKKVKKLTDGKLEYNITGVGVFENEEYDVLKLDIESDMLNELNEKASEYPYTNEHGDYNPHMTVAYLKPGKGKKYTQYFEPSIGMNSNRYSYSTVEGKKYYWY